MPETARDYSTQDDRFGPSAYPRERPQRLFRQDKGIRPGGAYRYPAGSSRYGSPRGPPYEAGVGGAYRGSGDGEVIRTVCYRGSANLPREELDPREAE